VTRVLGLVAMELPAPPQAAALMARILGRGLRVLRATIQAGAVEDAVDLVQVRRSWRRRAYGLGRANQHSIGSCRSSGLLTRELMSGRITGSWTLRARRSSPSKGTWKRR
jgi:hypothetical protein